jgi:hypothetical protein
VVIRFGEYCWASLVRGTPNDDDDHPGSAMTGTSHHPV